MADLRSLGEGGCARPGQEFDKDRLVQLSPSPKRHGEDALFVFCERPVSRRLRHLMRAVPSAPRCKICFCPFGGLGRVLPGPDFSPSRKNPNLCQRCFEAAPLGGREMEIGVLFADVRGYTELSEPRNPAEVAQLMNRFYALATDVFVQYDAIIDKLIGDEVMALFVPPWTTDAIPKMVQAAASLLRGVGVGSSEEPWLRLGVGAHYGRAFVGNVGAAEVKDFTAVGDVVNTAARLQAQAQTGQLIISERVYELVQEWCPAGPCVELQVKGKTEPVRARVIDADHAPSIAEPSH